MGTRWPLDRRTIAQEQSMAMTKKTAAKAKKKAAKKSAAKAAKKAARG